MRLPLHETAIDQECVHDPSSGFPFRAVRQRKAARHRFTAFKSRKSAGLFMERPNSPNY
jgi:hypothetical protein